MAVIVHPWGRKNLIVCVAFGLVCLVGSAILAFDFALCVRSWLDVVRQPSERVSVVSDADSIEEAWQHSLETGDPLLLRVTRPGESVERLTPCSIGPPSSGLSGLFGERSNEFVGVWLEYWNAPPNEVRVADGVIVFRWWLPARHLAFTLGVWLAMTLAGGGALHHTWKMWRSGATSFESDPHSHWGVVTAFCAAVVAAGMATHFWLLVKEESAFNAVAAEAAGGAAAVVVFPAVWVISRIVPRPRLPTHVL